MGPKLDVHEISNSRVGKEFAGFESAWNRWGCARGYEQTRVYLNQAMRNGGLVLDSEEGWCGVALSYGDGALNALVCPLTNEYRLFLNEALGMLSRDLGVELNRVMHIPEDALDGVGRLQGYKRVDWSGADYRYVEAMSEERYPQVLVNVERLEWTEWSGSLCSELERLPENEGLHDFRYQLKRFVRTNLDEDGAELECIPLGKCTVSNFETAADMWLKSIQERYNPEASPKIKDFCATFMNPVLAVVRVTVGGELESFGEIVRIDGTERGGWIGAPVSSQCLAAYVLIADTRIKNLGDFLMHRAVVSAADNDFKWLNLGGSEEKSLFEFKSKIVGDEEFGEYRQLYELRPVSGKQDRFAEINR